MLSKLGMVDYQVPSIVTRISKCSKCRTVIQITRKCGKVTVRSLYPGCHPSSSCIAQAAKCVNVHGTHYAKYEQSQRLKKDTALPKLQAWLSLPSTLSCSHSSIRNKGMSSCTGFDNLPVMFQLFLLHHHCYQQLDNLTRFCVS